MTNPCKLTPTQKKVFKALEMAFKDCSIAGLMVWDNYGTIEAVNGKKVTKPYPKDDQSGILYDNEGEHFNPKCWGGSNSDDNLYYEVRI